MLWCDGCNLLIRGLAAAGSGYTEHTRPHTAAGEGDMAATDWERGAGVKLASMYTLI